MMYCHDCPIAPFKFNLLYLRSLPMLQAFQIRGDVSATGCSMSRIRIARPRYRDGRHACIRVKGVRIITNLGLGKLSSDQRGCDGSTRAQRSAVLDVSIAGAASRRGSMTQSSARQIGKFPNSGLTMHLNRSGKTFVNRLGTDGTTYLGPTWVS